MNSDLLGTLEGEIVGFVSVVCVKEYRPLGMVGHGPWYSLQSIDIATHTYIYTRWNGGHFVDCKFQYRCSEEALHPHSHFFDPGHGIIISSTHYWVCWGLSVCLCRYHLSVCKTYARRIFHIHGHYIVTLTCMFTTLMPSFPYLLPPSFSSFLSAVSSSTLWRDLVVIHFVRAAWLGILTTHRSVPFAEPLLERYTHTHTHTHTHTKLYAKSFLSLLPTICVWGGGGWAPEVHLDFVQLMHSQCLVHF